MYVILFLPLVFLPAAGMGVAELWWLILVCARSFAPFLPVVEPVDCLLLTTAAVVCKVALSCCRLRIYRHCWCVFVSSP